MARTPDVRFILLGQRYCFKGRHWMPSKRFQPRENACNSCISIRVREYQKRGYRQSRNLRAKYGITLEERQAMWNRQEGKCAVCQIPGMLVVDHDHQTGKVRALLCSACNSAEGFLRSSPLIAHQMAAYLEQYGDTEKA